MFIYIYIYINICIYIYTCIYTSYYSTCIIIIGRFCDLYFDIYCTLVCIPEKLFISFKFTSYNLSVPLGSFSPLLVEFLCHHFIF